MRGIRFISAAVLVSLLMLGGCTQKVSVKNYEALVIERDFARAEVVSLRNELDALKQKMIQVKSLAEVMSDLFIPALTGEIKELTDNESKRYFFEWSEKIAASGDSLVQSKFQELVDSGFSEQQLKSFLVYLFKALSEKLE